MCSAELAEWLGLIVFESNRFLRDVLSDLRSVTPEEWQELAELHESRWPPFDPMAIENDLAQIVATHGDAVTVAGLGSLERAAG